MVAFTDFPVPTRTKGEGGETPTADPRTRAIWLTQLALGVSVAVIVLVVQVLLPVYFVSWTFVAGASLIVMVTATALAVPWDRFPRSAAAVLPLGDIVGVGVMSSGEDLHLTYLWVFPVIWLAAHFSLVLLVAGQLLIATMVVGEIAAVRAEGVDLLHGVVVMLSLVSISLTVYLATGQSRASRHLLRRSGVQLKAAAERAVIQERRVSVILNAIDVGIVHLSTTGEILDVNDTYRQLYGLDTAADEVTDSPLPTAAVEHRGLRGAEVLLRDRPLHRARRGETFGEERLWLFSPAGSWHAIAASATRLVDGAEAGSTLLVVHDITAMIEAERARERLVTVLSHELRNPLTAVIGHADLALGELGTPVSVRESLEHVARAGERMRVLIEEVLDRSNSRTERADVVDLSELVKASAQSFAGAAVKQSVVLSVSVPDPVAVNGDASRLRQAIDNLLSNAIKYSPGGGPVQLRCYLEGTRAIVTVQDEGLGIEAQELRYVFEPYFRARGAEGRGIAGTGLGMGIARQIVEKHAGSLSLDSQAGRGTTATMSLPASSLPAGEHSGAPILAESP